MHGKRIECLKAEGITPRLIFLAENLVNNFGMSGCGGIFDKPSTNFFPQTDTSEYNFSFNKIYKVKQIAFYGEIVYNESIKNKTVLIEASADGETFFRIGETIVNDIPCSEIYSGGVDKVFKADRFDAGGLYVKKIRVKILNGNAVFSQIRFYEDYSPATFESEIYSNVLFPENASVLCSDIGIKENGAHSNSETEMWLSEELPSNNHFLFDFEGTYPVDKILIYNYNGKGNEGAGLKGVKVFASLDNLQFDFIGEFPLKHGTAKETDDIMTAIKANNFEARYIKLEPCGSEFGGAISPVNLCQVKFGLSKVKFICGRGFAASPRYDLDYIFSSYEGWTGADGIFSVKLSESKEPLNKECLFVFSDTILGKADPVSKNRAEPVKMANNSFMRLKFENGQPVEREFIFGENGSKNLSSVINKKGEGWYWFQDMVRLEDAVYLLTGNLKENKAGGEGFEFESVGVDMIKIPLLKNKLDFKNALSFETPLFMKDKYFGSGILNNTTLNTNLATDDYIYIYGLEKKGYGKSGMPVLRVKSKNILNFAEYEAFNGEKFVADLSEAVPVSEISGSELSVTPKIVDGKIKYILAHMFEGRGLKISLNAADFPFKGFNKEYPVYQITACKEESRNNTLNKIYAYNVKAHPHLSSKGLIISYNVNAMTWKSNLENADIYRPRFIHVRSV